MHLRFEIEKNLNTKRKGPILHSTSSLASSVLWTPLSLTRVTWSKSVYCLSLSHTALTGHSKIQNRILNLWVFFESWGVEARNIEGLVSWKGGRSWRRRKFCGGLPEIIAYRKTERGIEEGEKTSARRVRSRAPCEVYTSLAPKNRLVKCLIFVP